jgi:hypothetical protein
MYLATGNRRLAIFQEQWVTSCSVLYLPMRFVRGKCALPSEASAGQKQKVDAEQTVVFANMRRAMSATLSDGWWAMGNEVKIGRIILCETICRG